MNRTFSWEGVEIPDMLSPPLQKVYNWDPIQWLVTTSGMDPLLRTCYFRFQEVRQGTSRFTVGDVSVEVSETTLPDSVYLQPERTVLADLLNALRPSDVFWDIGADRGLYTCLTGETISDGRVVAFEPHPIRRGELERNLQRNGVSALIRTEALSDTDGTAAFGYRIEPDGDGGEFTATLARGDQLVQRVAVYPPTAIKIDVEGAELAVLRGLEETLERDACRLVYVELHNRISDFGGTWEELKEFLRDRGFAIETIAKRVDDDYEQPYIKAQKRT